MLPSYPLQSHVADCPASTLMVRKTPGSVFDAHRNEIAGMIQFPPHAYAAPQIVLPIARRVRGLFRRVGAPLETATAPNRRVPLKRFRHRNTTFLGRCPLTLGYLLRTLPRLLCMTAGGTIAAPIAEILANGHRSGNGSKGWRSATHGWFRSPRRPAVPTQNSESQRKLEIFASPPYRRGHDHDSFRPPIPTLIPTS
jgi:hypothetical protein